MQTIALLDFFQTINYNYTKDLEKISKICYYTKTRVNPSIKEFQMSRGCEQPFLIKSIAEFYLAQNFFEIGTGRGTADYSLALIPGLKNITTVDILPFTAKFDTAIGYKKANVSLKDIFNLIPYPEKCKIRFRTRKEFFKQANETFDMCFIDGDHTNVNVILEDFNICRKLVGDGIFLFDDYELSKFSVKKVVDKILADNSDFNSLLIEFRGHLFGGDPERNEGLVIIKKGKII